METLSVEIMDEIIAYVFNHDDPDERNLAQYSTVNRYWQRTVEVETMQSINLSYDDMDDFSKVFSASSPHRRRHVLRKISLTTHMPAQSDSKEMNCQQNNLFFRDAVFKLLGELSSWEQDMSEGEKKARRRVPLDLVLKWEFREGQTWTRVLWNAFPRFPDDDGHTELPFVSFVTGLHIKAGPSLTPHPAALCRIASRMPSLKKLNFELSWPKNSALRLEHHKALAEGVEGYVLQLSYLSDIEIRLKDAINHEEHSVAQPDFTENGVDRLSTAIRKIGEAGRLTDLCLYCIPISSDLFCERNGSSLGRADENASTWPSIRRITIDSDMATADGKWLYTGDPPDYDFYNEHPEYVMGPVIWRRELDPAIFDPLIEIMTRTVTKGMPSLESFTLRMIPTWAKKTTVTLQVTEAEKGLHYDFEAYESSMWSGYGESKHRPRRKVILERIMAIGRKWIGELGTAKMTRAK